MFLKPICGENEVIIKATYSSLNYKDALSSVGNPGLLEFSTYYWR